MTLTQAAQLAVVGNASLSLTLALPTLLRTLALLGAQLRRAIRWRRPRRKRRSGAARTRQERAAPGPA